MEVHDLRAFAGDKHRQVDDIPYGGGPGMVLKPEPIFKAVRQIRGTTTAPCVLLTPQGRPLDRQLAAGLDNRHIAARMGIGYVTVRTHLRNLSSKLDAHSKVEILARAAELGLIVR